MNRLCTIFFFIGHLVEIRVAKPLQVTDTDIDMTINMSTNQMQINMQIQIVALHYNPILELL